MVGDGYAWATPPPIGTGRSVGQGLWGWELLGWVTEGRGVARHYWRDVTLSCVGRRGNVLERVY